MPKPKLNARQAMFVRLMLTGISVQEAVKAAGYAKRKDGRARTSKELSQQGAALSRQPAVVEAIEKAREKLIEKVDAPNPMIATRRDRQAVLTRFINDEALKPGTRMKAIQLLGAMKGDFIDRKEIKMDSTSRQIHSIDPRTLTDMQLAAMIARSQDQTAIDGGTLGAAQRLLSEYKQELAAEKVGLYSREDEPEPGIAVIDGETGE